jgi:hypothetical protein
MIGGCHCRAGKTTAFAGICLICWGTMAGAIPPPHHQHFHPAPFEISAVTAEPAEQPHPPETEATQPGSITVAAAVTPAAFRVEDPVLGRLDGNGLGP